ncbi:Ig-like domain-containing protein [Eubacterium limosum]|uniref:Ig-like domain-containing protein n=1 Tax=Eubacterium limosum TaxID=1736 RepID=A0ABT5UTM7_EUBLI|nr:Ig-like domain-containing protein [Eubacterium limosum]MCB6571009.1 Ig-like domain-containing protein [Eubacterium limosum]MDE1472241.1 Ig-like domain-containing protein [Eubacterium limosum]
MEAYKCSAVKRWLSIMLIIAMVLSTCTPFQKAFAAEEKAGEEAVVVSIEKQTVDANNGALLNPTQVMPSEVDGENAKLFIKTVYGENSIEEGLDDDINYKITGVKDPSESSGMLKDGDKGEASSWVCFINSKRAPEPGFVHVAGGDVIRLIYTVDGGADIGMENDTLNVKKDALMAKYAGISSDQIGAPMPMNPLFKAYQDAGKVLKDLDSTQPEADGALAKLEELFPGSEMPDPEPEEISVSPEKSALLPGETVQLKADGPQKVSWSSNNENIASVDANGLVTAKAEGNATVTAEAGSKEAHAIIAVLPEEEVNMTSGAVSVESNGELVIEPTLVSFKGENGQDLTYTIYGALRKALETSGLDPEKVDLGMDSAWNDIITAVPTKEGSTINNGSLGENSRWLTFILNKNEKNCTAFSKEKPKPGRTVRVIFSKDGGADIGLSEGALAVNKDKLILKAAEINADKSVIDSDEKQGLYDTALSLIKDANAAQEAVDAAYMSLRKAFVSYPEPDVPPEDIPATAVHVTPQEATVREEESVSLQASVEPENTTDKVQWSSSDESVATVDEEGLVTGQKTGKVQITATAGDVIGKANITVEPKIIIPAESLILSENKTEIKEGGYVDLTADVKPENTTDKVVWNSEDSSIASVSDTGRVVGQKAGKVKIKATAGEKEAVCEVTVTTRNIATEPSVYFRYSDGRIQEMDGSGSFTLTVLDEGNFVLEGSDKKAYWQCSEDYEENGQHGTNVWVSSQSGKYNPYGVRTVEAKVINEETKWDEKPEVIKTFKINTVSSEIESLSLYVDNKQVSLEKPVTVAGDEAKTVEVRGHKAGENKDTLLPKQSYRGSGSESFASISRDGTFVFGKPGTADFTIEMIDNTAVNASFRATSEKVGVERMEVEVPEVWDIDAWNGLGGYYVGITDYKVKIHPENASNKEVEWKALNPEVAEYMVMFANGIVPKKAGTAAFEVTSKDNPSLKQTVSVEFRYKKPLKSASVGKNIEIEQYQSLSLDLNCSPEDATEQRYDWSYDKPGIVELKDSVQQVGDDWRNYRAIHTLTAKQTGTVTVTGTPWDTTGGAKPITFTVDVKEEGSGGTIDYAQMAKDDLLHGQQYLEGDSVSKSVYGDEWSIFTTLRAGGTITQEDKDNYLAAIEEKAASGFFDKAAPTDRARVILTLGVMGKDPTNVGGVNLIEKTYNDTSLATQSSNQISWSLIAMDSQQYETPEGALWNRNAIISELLTFQKETGGFGLSKEGTGDSVDMTAMVLQALAPYNDAEHQEVQAAFEKGLSYIKAKLTSNCGFIEGGSENGCTGAQVLTLLSIAKIDPLSETNGFTLGKKNLITNLDSFKLESGGFKTYATNEDEPDNVKLMSSQQITYALEAYDRFVNNENSLYDLTDVGNEGPVDPPVDPDKEKDEAAAKAVTDQILAIGEITSYEQKATVDAARQAYNKLTRAQKAYVTEETLKVLTDAEAAIKALAPLKGTVNFDVERFTIGQGFYKEPVQVPFYEGETGTEIIKRVIGDENFVGQDSYLEAIKGADAGSDKLQIPAYIVQKLNGADTEAARTFGNDYADSALGQFSYSQESGWMYYVNNVEMPYGINAYQPKDGDTMRLMFTYCGYGKDLSGKDYGSSEAIAKIANKDRLIAAAAAMNTPQATAANTNSADSETVKLAYGRALKAIENMTLSQEATDKAEKDLKAAMAGDSSWVEKVKAVEVLEQSAEQFADYEGVRLKDKENVEKLIKDYEALSAEEKHSVLNMTYLEAAKIQLEALENAEKAMNEQVQVVKKALAGNYTQESSEAVRVVLAQAEALDTQTADAEAMKQMAKELSDSLKILVPAADKTGLAESLEKADAVTGSYTQETWQPFLKARVAARELMKNNNLKAEEQNVVESAKAELDRTMAALIAVGDKTDLGEMIVEMEKVNTSPYTKASGEAFKEALEAAKAVYNDPNATEAQISEAMTALKNAKLALAPKSQGEDPEKADSEQAKKNAEASGKNVSTGILEDDMSSAFTCAALLAMISLAGTVAVRKRKEQ